MSVSAIPCRWNRSMPPTAFPPTEPWRVRVLEPSEPSLVSFETTIHWMALNSLWVGCRRLLLAFVSALMSDRSLSMRMRVQALMILNVGQAKARVRGGSRFHRQLFSMHTHKWGVFESEKYFWVGVALWFFTFSIIIISCEFSYIFRNSLR